MAQTASKGGQPFGSGPAARPGIQRSPWRYLVEAGLLGLIIAAFTSVVLSVIAVPSPFGHDEAVYASHARHIIEGTPDTAYGLHRAPALPAVGLIVAVLSESESAFRSVGLMFGVVAVLSVWWLARMAADPGDSPTGTVRFSAAVAGLAAATALAASEQITYAAASYVTDLPAAAVLTIAGGVLWRELELRQAPGWGLLAVAPLLTLAFELRFGSALFIALLLLVATGLWWDRLRRRRAPAVATLGLLIALHIPHIANAMAVFGTPWGRVLYTAAAGGQSVAYPGEGLIDYIEQLPFDLTGALSGILMVAGTVAGLGSLALAPFHRRWTRRQRAWTFLLTPALLHVVLMGVRVPADVRFLFPAIACLCAAGGVFLAGVAARLDQRESAPTTYLTRAVLIAGLALAITMFSPIRDNVVAGRERFAQSHENVRDIAAEIDARSEGECFVVTSYVPQVLWYSGCGTGEFRHVTPEELTDPAIRFGEAFSTRARWVAVFDRGKRQPEGAALEDYLTLTDRSNEIVVETGGRSIAWGRAYPVDPTHIESP